MLKQTYKISTENGMFNALIWFNKKDSAYLVKIPRLPEVVTFGKTLTEAKRMAADAIELFCECAIEEGKLVVDDRSFVTGHIPKTGVLTVAS